MCAGSKESRARGVVMEEEPENNASRVDEADLVPATPEAILALRGHPDVGPEAIRRALELALPSPAPEAWARFLDRTLLFLGGLLATSGVLFFVASNWQALGRLARLGLVEAAVVLAALGAWRLGPERLAGQVLLTVGAALVGPLLGVYGQIYQTGADAWNLFLAWGLLILPWVLVGRNPVLWLLLLGLGNLTAWLAWDQLAGTDPWDSTSFYLWACAANSLAWGAWEFFRRRNPGPLTSSWVSRALAALCLFYAAVPSWMAILDSRFEGPWLGPVFLAALLMAIFRLLRPRERDLFQPAAGLAAAISVVTVTASRVLLEESETQEAGVLLIGFLVLAQVAGAAAWLRRAGRSS